MINSAEVMSEAITFFSRVGYQRLPTTDRLHMVRRENPLHRFPRDHITGEPDSDGLISIGSLDIHYDPRQHQRHMVLQAARELTVVEIQRLIAELRTTDYVSEEARRQLSGRLNYLIYFATADFVRHLREVRVRKGLAVEEKHLSRDVFSGFKYTRDRQWRRELEELKFS